MTLTIINGDRKTCTKCGEEKHFDEFAKFVGRANDIGSWCKDCKNKARKKYRAENLDREKQSFADYYYTRGGRQVSYEGKLRRRFKLTPEAFLELSKGGCAICGSIENLCVDHDHKCCPTDKTCGECVRGILCRRHNLGEGFFENTGEIEAFLRYRKEWENR